MEKNDLKSILSKQAELNDIFMENNVSLAYLFGSVAKDKAGPLSDIDFAVVFNSDVSKDEQFEKELKLAGELGRFFETDKIDLVNFERASSPVLKHNIVFLGKVIFAGDVKKRFEIQRKTLCEYEDTKHLRSTQYAIMRKHIQEGTFGRPMISKYDANSFNRV